MKKTVIVQFDIEGFHNYPKAPNAVRFLENKHRHTFKIKCGYSVGDTNREKEIFIQRDILKDYINESYGVPALFDNMSCEMIALEILEFSKEDGMTWCEVWEENTGGGRVEL